MIARGIIYFNWGSEDGRDLPVYFRKAYRKARWKRKSERLAPGYWEQNVKQPFSQWAEKWEREHGYKNCDAYKIKEPVNGICTGNENTIGEYSEKCNTCPAYLRYKERTDT